ncbi:MAG TPA: alpha/beta hydrolase-fold protein, partial [Gemmataceae bacterium]|nr:alpha/beta hydrolase-fold protein [Gemmataceae bacterium]
PQARRLACGLEGIRVGTWHEVEIAGRPAQVFDLRPKHWPRFGLLYLHDFHGAKLRDHPIFEHYLEQFQLACICAEGKQCWWVDRICSEFDTNFSPEAYLLAAVLPVFESRWSLKPPAIGVLGYEMGGQGALRLAFKYPERFPAVAAVTPAIEYHEWYYRDTPIMDMYTSKEQCRQDTAPMHVHPTSFPPHIFFCCDPAEREWFRGADRLHEKLSALGISHQCDLETQAGGGLAYFEKMAEPALRFLIAGLEKVSRRLL